MSFNDDGTMMLSKINHFVTIPGVEVLDEDPIVSYEGTYRIDGGNYITAEIKDCGKDSEKIVVSILGIPDSNYCLVTASKELPTKATLS